jgi:phage terminase large subunit-like protein
LYLPAGCPTNQAVIDELKAIRPSLKKTKDDIADVITDAFIYTYRENGIRDNFIKGRNQESKKAFFFQ